MAGHLNGVAAQIKRHEPRALFVHCLAHSVNLCLQESGKQSRSISDALTLVNELYNFIQLSPKRLALLTLLKMNWLLVILLSNLFVLQIDCKNPCY